MLPCPADLSLGWDFLRGQGENGAVRTYCQVKLGICLLLSLLPALVCCHTQDKWMGQGGRKGGGEESQNILCLELPHDLFRLLLWASPACI